MRVYIRRWRLEVNVRYSLSIFSTFFSGTGTPIEPDLVNWLAGWRVSFWDPAVPTSQHWDYKHGYPQRVFSHGCCGPEFKSSCLLDKHFTNLTICPLSLNIYICTAVTSSALVEHGLSLIHRSIKWRYGEWEIYQQWLYLSFLVSPSSRLVASCTFSLCFSSTSLLWQETWWSSLL